MELAFTLAHLYQSISLIGQVPELFDHFDMGVLRTLRGLVVGCSKIASFVGISCNSVQLDNIEV
jgi:hypothetical protein